MTDRNPPALEDVFRTLDRWRHLPAYRLEPNLAPLFGFFLHDILREALIIETDSTIIPEFPLRLGTLYGDNETCSKNSGMNQSVKVDYMVFERDKGKVYFVELKTDDGSFDKKQCRHPYKAKNCVNFNCLLCGIVEMCKITDQRAKYVHLLCNLREVNLIAISDKAVGELYKLSHKENATGWSKELRCVAPSMRTSPKVEIVYITPSGNTVCETKGEKIKTLKEVGFHEIGFDCVAETVWKRGGIGREFAYYLRKWIEPAGVADPRKFRAVP